MLEVHDDATEDLELLLRMQPKSAMRLVALLEQLRLDDELQDRLLDHGHGSEGSEPIDVSRWHNVRRIEGTPLWRLKFRDLEEVGLRFRVIYLFDHTTRTYWVLAVAPRKKLDYDDPQNPYRLRALATVRREFGHV